MQRYNLEFILNTYENTIEAIRNQLTEFGDNLEIFHLPDTQANLPAGQAGKGDDFRIQINTEDPTIIFDACAQFGRIKSIKINEIKGHP